MTWWQEAMLYFAFGYALLRTVYFVVVGIRHLKIRLRWGVW